MDHWNTVMDLLGSMDLQGIHWALPFDGQRLSLAIVEPREHKHLKAVLNSVARLYGIVGSSSPEVSLFIFHGTDNKSFVKDIVKNWPGTHLINIGLKNLDRSGSYSQLLTSKSFFRWFKSSHVLIFQTDSLLLKPIDDEWFAYDYVGAPCGQIGTQIWAPYTQNGGFSLRNPKTMIRYLDKFGEPENPWNEDIWWCRELTSSRGKSLGITMPSRDKATEFSVEGIFYPSPVGTHRPYSYLKDTEVHDLLKSLHDAIASIELSTEASTEASTESKKPANEDYKLDDTLSSIVETIVDEDIRPNSYALFAMHGALDESRASYIRYLEELPIETIIVITTDEEHLQEAQEFNFSSKVVIVYRPNGGHDFGLWQSQLSLVKDASLLVLCNDSCICEGSLVPMWQSMRSSRFWGPTDSNEHKWHLQSYFLVFDDARVVNKACEYIEQQNFQSKPKDFIIHTGEIGLSQWLIKNGYRPTAVYDIKSLQQKSRTSYGNSSFYMWRTLKLLGCPLIKRNKS